MRRRQIVLAASAISISTLLTLIGLELLARIVLSQPPPLLVSSGDARLIYELNPRHPEINSFGMRQEEFDPAALRDRFVIAVLGDSHAYSVGSARRENSFPARLEYHLRASGRRVTVLNFAAPGYNMAQELALLRYKALPFGPDLIILQYCINDEHISNFIQPERMWLNHEIHGSILLSRAWMKLLYSGLGIRHLLPYIEEHAPDLLLQSPGLVGTLRAREDDPAHAPHPPRSKDRVPARYHDLIGRDNVERDVRAFGRIAKDAGIPAVATGFIEDRHRALYESSGFTVDSFFEIFRGRDMRDYGYDPTRTDTHFADSGSDLIGKALADFLEAHFTLAKK